MSLNLVFKSFYKIILSSINTILQICTIATNIIIGYINNKPERRTKKDNHFYTKLIILEDIYYLFIFVASLNFYRFYINSFKKIILQICRFRCLKNNIFSSLYLNWNLLSFEFIEQKKKKLLLILTHILF